jgi:predicted nucleic acid-binding protein
MDIDDQKRLIAEQILISKPFISAQVLTEVANVCKRRFKYRKDQLLNLWGDLLTDCILTQTDVATFNKAIALSKQYDFQLFDSLIVASALNTGCSMLYSEDMQHQMVIEKSLTIVNPFA